MLKFFSRNTSDHPFADLKVARELLAAIASGDSLASLEDLIHWLQSVRGEAAFKANHRAQALLLIDETAQMHVRRLARDYLGSTRLLKQQEMRIWNAVDTYLKEASISFTVALEQLAADSRATDATKSTLALLAVRDLRMLATQLKWMHLRYGPVDTSLWSMVSRVYAVAEQTRISQLPVVAYPSLPGETTMQRELLRLFMFAACSPDTLVPVEMELAERLIAHFAPRFAAAGEPSAATPYWVDLGAAAAPRRGAVPAEAVGPIGYFGAASAYSGLLTLAAEIRAAGAVPSQLSLGGTYETEHVLPVLDHLEQHWSPKLPERKYIRQSAKLRLTVTRGFDGVLDVLQLPAGQVPEGEEIESWIMEDISAGGFGALVPAIKQDWLHIGCLLGLHYEGGSHWSVGIVRRLVRSGGQQANVGLEVLSRAAVPVELRIKTDYGLSLDSEVGVLLPALRIDEELRLLLRPGVYDAGQTFKIERAGGDRLLVPARTVERGNDYELLAVRESRQT